jgi:uncharacterized BrkB/YihY/UPF0761 family membrane protein
MIRTVFLAVYIAALVAMVWALSFGYEAFTAQLRRWLPRGSVPSDEMGRPFARLAAIAGTVMLLAVLVILLFFPMPDTGPK